MPSKPEPIVRLAVQTARQITDRPCSFQKLISAQAVASGFWAKIRSWSRKLYLKLENSYGELTGKPDFGECLLAAAKIIVEDNFSDYYTELCGVAHSSFS